MHIGFDPKKNAINIAQHGVPLAFGGKVFADPDHIVVETIRLEDGEDRYKAIGMIEGRLWTAVHVVRGSVVRFVSVRKSNNGEKRIYNRP